MAVLLPTFLNFIGFNLPIKFQEHLKLWVCNVESNIRMKQPSNAPNFLIVS